MLLPSFLTTIAVLLLPAHPARGTRWGPRDRDTHRHYHPPAPPGFTSTTTATTTTTVQQDDVHNITACRVTKTTINVTRIGDLCNECTHTTYMCPTPVQEPCSQVHAHRKDTPDPASERDVLEEWGGGLEYGDDDDDDDDDDYADTHYPQGWQYGHVATKLRPPVKSPSPPSGAHHLCHTFVMGPINDVRCHVTCCNGSHLDPVTNSCSPPQASQDPDCLNGGTSMDDAVAARAQSNVTEPLNKAWLTKVLPPWMDNVLRGATKDRADRKCLCPPDFTGERCEQRSCTVRCHNGGVCKRGANDLSDSHPSVDFCVCPSSFAGFFCETPVCQGCGNNGICFAKVGMTFCRCKPGFMGPSCTQVSRKGECPPKTEVVSVTAVWRSADRCRWDSDCTGELKCCRYGVRGRCVHPVTKEDEKPVCKYGNMTYDIGTAFQLDACLVCTCNSSHVTNSSHGSVQCTRLVCPALHNTSCRHIEQRPGQCCATCQDYWSQDHCDGPYTAPRFVNCPPQTVTLQVGPDSDLAPIELDLRAVDCNGRRLSVSLSDRFFTAGQGEDNFHLVSAASDPDENGQYAQCLFHIRVRDVHPPEFLTCPSDFTLPSPGIVTWDEPVAVDNVGLAIPPTSRQHPGGHLGPGSHVVLYWAEDFEGNVARCVFVVTIAGQPNDRPSLSDSWIKGPYLRDQGRHGQGQGRNGQCQSHQRPGQGDRRKDQGDRGQGQGHQGQDQGHRGQGQGHQGQGQGHRGQDRDDQRQVQHASQTQDVHEETYQDEEGRVWSVGVGVTGGVLLVLVPLVFFVLWRRHARPHSHSSDCPVVATASGRGEDMTVDMTLGSASGALPPYSPAQGDVMVLHPTNRRPDDVRGMVYGAEVDVIVKNPFSE